MKEKTRLTNPGQRQNNLRQFLLFGLLLVLLICFVLTLMMSKLAPVSQLPKPTPTLAVAPTPILETAKPQASPAGWVAPIRLFDPPKKNEILPIVLYSDPSDCQPVFFDPKISHYKKVIQNGTPAIAYEVEDSNDPNSGYHMMINGWSKENEDKIDLPAPYSVTFYEFGCASSSSYVIDLNKDGKRQALYTQVEKFDFSPDGKSLFLINYIKNQDKWELHRRIINLETQEAFELANFRGMSTYHNGFWQGNRLVTYEQHISEEFANEYEPPNSWGPDDVYWTHVAIWDERGQLIARLGSTSDWGAAAGDYLAEPIGLLPKDSDVFWAYMGDSNRVADPVGSYSVEEQDVYCKVFLFDIKSGATKLITPLKKDQKPVLDTLRCEDQTEFDFSQLKFSGGILKYKLDSEYEPTGRVWRQVRLEK